MVELFALINGLNPEEIKAIRSSFKKGSEEDSVAMEELYTVILSSKGKSITDHELSIVIYEKEKLAAVAKLKSRLFQFILEILSSDTILSKEQLFDTSDRHVIRVRKKMLQFRVLYRKKNKVDPSVLYHLLSEVIKEAKEYEQYDVLVEALYFKKTMLMIRKGFAEIRQIEKQIDLYHETYKALLRTNSHYFELIANQDLLYQKKPAQIKELLRAAIAEIEEYIKITNSPSIQYFYKLLQLEELIRDNRHDVSIDVCLDILNIMNTHKHLYRKERVGFVYDNISLCQVYRNNIDDSIASAQKAQEYFTPGSFNFMISKQQEFLACFYGSSYNRAYAIIVQLLNFPVINVGEFRHDKYLFYEAATLFKLEDQRAALIICNHALELSKDKSRWDLGIRYLRLMCMIELQQSDQAYSAIEALRKTMGRSEKDTLSNRDELIYRALNEFASTGFSTTPTGKLIDLINMLAVKDSDCSWNYYTHELIPVHKWIESKIVTKKNAPTQYVLK